MSDLSSVRCALALAATLLALASGCDEPVDQRGGAAKTGATKTGAEKTGAEQRAPGDASSAGAAGAPADDARRRRGAYQVVEVRDGGTIRVVAKYTGDALVAPAAISVSADVAHCGGKVFAQDLVVDPATKTLANVVVRLEDVAAGKAPAADLLVTNRDCSFDPHVSVAMSGAKLKARNVDPISHTTHPYYENGSFFNWPFGSASAEAPAEFPGKKIERLGVITMRCDVHSWMNAFIVVHDNPYIEVTNVAGTLSLDQVPPGTYPWTAWHETLGQQKGKITVTSGGTSELTLEFAPR